MAKSVPTRTDLLRISKVVMARDNTMAREYVKRRNTKSGDCQNGDYLKGRPRWAWCCIGGTQGAMPRGRYYGERDVKRGGKKGE